MDVETGRRILCRDASITFFRLIMYTSACFLALFDTDRNTKMSNLLSIIQSGAS